MSSSRHATDRLGTKGEPLPVESDVRRGGRHGLRRLARGDSSSESGNVTWVGLMMRLRESGRSRTIAGCLELSKTTSEGGKKGAGNRRDRIPAASIADQFHGEEKVGVEKGRNEESGGTSIQENNFESKCWEGGCWMRSKGAQVPLLRPAYLKRRRRLRLRNGLIHY